ncbi:MAG: hypothetical protein HYV63_10625 [Candidatus Schekmanbacteria bacterium]|nr:hypothetical protein [Candidatus Schekmanbacteria bacterium]
MAESIVVHHSFHSSALGYEKRYCIYLPPSYPYRPDLRYSTLFLLPGLLDYERTWVDRGRIQEHMDELLCAGTVGEMIVVMPDKDDAALDENRRTEFAGYLGRDLIDHIDREYRTLGWRGHRGIEGLSLGASWAIRMLLYFPELYCSVGCLSGAFGEECWRLLEQKQWHLHRAGTRFRVGVGSSESDLIPGNLEFVNHLRGLGFYCEYDQMEGPHDWELWSRQVRHSLQFHYFSFNPK